MEVLVQFWVGIRLTERRETTRRVVLGPDEEVHQRLGLALVGVLPSAAGNLAGMCPTTATAEATAHSTSGHTGERKAQTQHEYQR